MLCIKRIALRSKITAAILAAMLVVSTACTSSTSDADGPIESDPADPSWLSDPYNIDYDPHDLECGAPTVGYSEAELQEYSHTNLRRQAYCVSFKDGQVKFTAVRPQVEAFGDSWFQSGYTMISGPLDQPVILVDDGYCVSASDGEDCPLTKQLYKTCTSWHGYPNIDPLWQCLSGNGSASKYALSRALVVDCSERDLRVVTQRSSFDCSTEFRLESEFHEESPAAK